MACMHTVRLWACHAPWVSVCACPPAKAPAHSSTLLPPTCASTMSCVISRVGGRTTRPPPPATLAAAAAAAAPGDTQAPVSGPAAAPAAAAAAGPGPAVLPWRTLASAPSAQHSLARSRSLTQSMQPAWVMGRHAHVRTCVAITSQHFASTCPSLARALADHVLLSTRDSPRTLAFQGHWACAAV